MRSFCFALFISTKSHIEMLMETDYDERKNRCRKSSNAGTILEYSKSADEWRLRKYPSNNQYNVIRIGNSMEEIVIRCGKVITHLDLRSLFYHNFVSPIVMATKYCKNIQYIYTSEQLSLTPTEMYPIIDNWNELKVLCVSLIAKNNEGELSELLSVNKNLKYFAIKNDIYINEMTGMFLEYLPVNVIEEINLTRCVALMPHFFIYTLQKCERLRALTLISCNFINNNAIEVICERKTLRKLNISDIPPLCAHVFNQRIINLEYLEELSLTDNCWINDEFIMNVSFNCRQIKLLDVSLCLGITNRGIATVVNLKKLEILRINWVFRVNDEPLGNLHNLRELMCHGCHEITDNGIIRLIKLAPYLNKLNLSQCSITNSTIETAIAITNKRKCNITLEINIFNTDIDISELLLLESSPLLRIINTDTRNIDLHFFKN